MIAMLLAAGRGEARWHWIGEPGEPEKVPFDDIRVRLDDDLDARRRSVTKPAHKGVGEGSLRLKSR